MAGSAFKDSQVVELAKTFTPVLVDANAASDLVEKYNVAVQPTVVYTDASGAELVKTLDAVSVDEFLADLKSAVDHLKPTDAPK